MFDISRETAKAWKNIQTFAPSAMLYIVVLIIVIVVGVRITSDDITAARLDQTTLLYIAFAGVLILVVTGRVKTFEIPNVLKMELETIKKELEESQAQAREAKAEANAAHDALRYGTVTSANSKQPEYEMSASEAVLPGPHASDDPNKDDAWKGQFGGENIRDNRKLSATLIPATDSPGYFFVTLVVESTKPARDPLTGFVQFYLHRLTFQEHKPKVQVINGVATLTLKVWVCFTVGAIVSDKRTMLELDLVDVAQEEADRLRESNPALADELEKFAQR